MDSKKKKRKFDFTLMFVPHGNNQVYSYKIPAKVTKTLIVLGILLALLIFYIIGYFFFMRNNIAELKDLRDQTKKEKEKVQLLQKQTDEMKSKMQDIDNLDKQIKELVGLDNKQTTRGSSKNNLNNSDSKTGTEEEILEKDLKTLSVKISEKENYLPDLKNKISDKKAYLAAQPTLFPVEGSITSPFGYRKSPFGKKSEFHDGVDIAAAYGTPVKAAADGVVTSAGWKSGYGKEVTIDHGFGISTGYGHNSVILVQVGQTVKKGDIISKVGSTGRSTGPHLHFRVFINGKVVDPMRYLVK